jgi:hypothetical protein
MTNERNPGYAAELTALAERLNLCEQVTRFDTAAEQQASKLAYNFLDLAESFRTFLNEQLPRIRDERLTCAEIDEVLGDIGEEFRHILWHIHNAEFYAYLRDDTLSAPPDAEHDPT